MKKLSVLLCVVLLTSCGPSQEEKQAAEMERQRVEKQASEKLAKEKANRTAAVTCAIMGESRNMDASIRVEKLNEARDKISGEPFLDGDDAIKEAFKYDLCKELVLNETYDQSLQYLKEAERERERIAAEKRAEEQRIAAEKQRIAAEKQEEERRIAAEKQRIADSKPTAKEEFWPNGKLKSRTNYQAKNVGGKEHGLYESYHENGQLRGKGNYKDGEQHGLFESYSENGQLSTKLNYKDGEQHGLYEFYRENGQLRYKVNYKDGEQHGLFESYDKDGKEYSSSPQCYQNGAEVDMSNCK